MKKYPHIPLTVLASAVALIGYFLTKNGIQCRGEPLMPGETCDFPSGPSTHEELAAQPLRRFDTFLIAAGVVFGLAVVAGLFRRPKRVMSKFVWPGRVTVASLVGFGVAAGLVLAFGAFYTSLPTTCGGQELGPGDRCLNLDTGTSSSAGDLEGALLNQMWVYVLTAVVLVTIALIRFLRRRPPTEEELTEFARHVEKTRRHIDDLERMPLWNDDEGRAEIADMRERLEAEIADESHRATGGKRPDTVDG